MKKHTARVNWEPAPLARRTETATVVFSMYVNVCACALAGFRINTLQYSCTVKLHFLGNTSRLKFFHLSFRPVFPCGGHLVTDSTIVASEGFPSFYKPNSKCIWYITVSHNTSCRNSVSKLLRIVWFNLSKVLSPLCVFLFFCIKTCEGNGFLCRTYTK